MRIIGIDPGYAIVGYGIIGYNGTQFNCIEYGAIRTSPEMPFSDRLAHIYTSLGGLLNAFSPQCMAVEKLFFNSNSKTAIDVAQARGVILLSAHQNQVPIFEYTPLQVKQAVVGYGRAEKNQVMQMTKLLLNLAAIPKPDDAADALAMAICCANSAGRRFL